MPGLDSDTLGLDIESYRTFTKTWHNSPYPFISPSRPELSAAGKNVVVTGGGTGIGQAIAIAFAQAGATSVTIIGRRLEKLTSGVTAIQDAATTANSTTQVFYQQADLVSREETTKAFQAIASQVPGGKLHVLVSNAGMTMSEARVGPIAYATDDNLLSAFQGFVLTAIHAIQAFLPLVVANENPVILSTSTCFAHWPATGVPLGLYSANRAALLKLTDYIQKENPHVRVVSVQPGWVASEANGFQKEATDSADLPGQFYLWLASREAEFLKGKFVWANWDAEELLERAEGIGAGKLLTTVLEGVDN
ncbi:putative short chain dehydrogenase reductase [Podospora australis]|uniref:Short chain dehydrogenase reductase n=1 Tax=Podospora australis TaxID=1536484 RepID=A0AAN6WT80_9PEZI|nr:putative short chain dehydrogenase reductase [Podospora australis]